MISKRRQANKNKPFKQIDIVGLRVVENWDDYPNHTTKNVSMEHKSASSFPREKSSPMNLSNIVRMLGDVSSLMRFSESTKKRDHAKTMDTNDIDTVNMPKKYKMELEQQMV